MSHQKGIPLPLYQSYFKGSEASEVACRCDMPAEVLASVLSLNIADIMLWVMREIKGLCNLVEQCKHSLTHKNSKDNSSSLQSECCFL